MRAHVRARVRVCVCAEERSRGEGAGRGRCSCKRTRQRRPAGSAATPASRLSCGEDGADRHARAVVGAVVGPTARRAADAASALVPAPVPSVGRWRLSHPVCPSRRPRPSSSASSPALALPVRSPVRCCPRLSPAIFPSPSPPPLAPTGTTRVSAPPSAPHSPPWTWRSSRKAQ